MADKGEEDEGIVTVSVTVEVGKEENGLRNDRDAGDNQGSGNNQDTEDNQGTGNDQDAEDNQGTVGSREEADKSSPTAPAGEETTKENSDGSSELKEAKEEGEPPGKEEKLEESEPSECIKKEMASDAVEKEEERNDFSQQSSVPNENLEKVSSEKEVEGEAQEVEEISGKSGTEGEKKKRKLTPYWKLFRYAGMLDVVMVVLGFLMAVASGVALPGHIILFGRVINSFSYHMRVSNEMNGTSITSVVNMVARSRSSPCSVSLAEEIFTNISQTQSQNVMLLCSDQADAIFDDVATYACDPDSELTSFVNLFSIYYVVMGVGVIISVFFANVFFNTSAYRQSRCIRRAFYQSILHQEVGWFDVNEVNELSTRLVDDVEKIQAGIGDKLVLFINSITTFIAGFVIAFTFSWKMALVMCCVLPIIVVISAIIAKITASFSIREQNAYAAAGGVAEEVLAAIRTVAAFGGEDHEAERYNVQLGKAKKVGIRKGFFTSLSIASLQFFIFATFALGYWYGSTLIIGCELGPGDVVTVFIGILLGSFSLGTALPELETFGSAMGAATVVFEIIDRKSAIDAGSSEGDEPSSLTGHIKFEDVKFHYPARPNIQVLKGLNLEVRPGQTVALVGPSGCGKSTVIQLLQRFYDSTAGQVTVDGRDVASLNLKWWRAHIGVVSQEPVLFDTTIAENIRYGREDATMEEIEAAARHANAHEFISKFPQGYATDVGESGGQMSGGQKQRIAIARALVRDPKILLLDEATSALDTESEKIVQEALDKAREGRTTIVIAHRLSTIQTADVIISIKEGNVVEQGTHLELMDNEDVYYELVTAQTIVENEGGASDGLTEFRAAVKRSQSSTSGGGKLAYNKQASVLSQEQFRFEVNELARVTLEDLPGVGAPSPYPGRATFPGDDTISIASSHREVDVVKKRHSSKLARLSHKRNKEGKNEELKKVKFKELLALNKPDWPFVVVGVIASAFIGIFFPAMAPLFSELLRIFSLTDPDEIARLTSYVVAAFVVLAVLAGVVYFLGFMSLGAAGERLTKRLRLASFKAMLQQDIGWFDLKSNSTGVLSTRLASDAADVKGATGIRIGTVLQILFGLVAAVVIAFSACWEVAFVFMVGFPIIGGFSFVQIRLVAGRSQSNKAKLEESGAIVVESLANMRTVVGLGVEDKFYSKYSQLLHGPFRDNIRNVLMQSLVLGVAQSIIFFLYSAGYSFGGFLVIRDRCSFDEVFRVFAAVIFTAFNLGRASSYATEAGKSRLAAARILTLLDRVPSIDVSSTDGEKLEKTRGLVALENVYFNYPTRPEVKVLQGLKTRVEPGQTLALVGPSGCGKSTTVSLLERFYDPVQGFVTLEGTDLRDLNLRWLRTQIGIVSQEPVLFDASVADNIRYGALFRDVSDSEVIDAAKSANIHSFIDSLPEGYNTNVGAKGTQLSGGQKQRIAIARALVRDPKILLLDEATSALDTESEKIVQEALDKAREGRTTIVIAHRLSTIYNSDVIAVIHNGQVIESGNHSQLMATRGAYYLLNTVQLEDDDFS